MTLDRTPVGIANLGQHGEWQLINAPLCELLGLQKSELTHKRFEALLGVDLHNGDVGPLEREYTRANGQHVWLSITVTRAYDPEQRCPYFVAIVEDISAQKACERTLGIAAHELRLPLSHVKGFISTLRRTDIEWDSATRSDFLADAEHELDRLDLLITELLDQASGSARAHPRRTTISPRSLVLTTIARLRPMLEGREVRADVPSDLPALQVEIPAMERVLANLLLNAHAYSPRHAPIDVLARQVGDTVELSVQDRGPGVPRREHERIFEPFYRGTKARSAGTAFSGHGLGLAICRSIVTAQGGRIWVAPRPGGGSSFTASMPIVRQPARRQEARKSAVAAFAAPPNHYSRMPGARPVQTPT
jgi:signal transduction histidine kinase